jgi:ppGpp synthetase/RelA/SpoT-type nucleotidyltranferase
MDPIEAPQQEFDFQEHKRQTAINYQNVRPLYEDFADVVKNLLSQAFDANEIKVQSIESRAKRVDSFARKASIPSPEDPNQPLYPNPLADITDLAGVRVITFFPRTLDLVDGVIRGEFEIVEKSDKTQILIKEERFGYGSIHYLVRLGKNRTNLLEYKKFQNLVAEIQVRTILQHAWAEIEHDIQYKSLNTIPTTIRRRFVSLAGMLEIADREFQAIQDEDERLTREARKSVQEGKLEQVEITPDALKTYLDSKLGADGRMANWSYEYTAGILRRLGFTDFKQIDECIAGYDDDILSRTLSGTRQGQITRFEVLLLAGMGENYIKSHPWHNSDWFVKSRTLDLKKFEEKGIKTACYLPPANETSFQ